MDASVNFVARTNKGLTHFNTLVPRVRKLESRFALDQLRGLAQHICQTDFLSWIAFIFGFDIDAKTCDKLRQALLDDSVLNPPIEIVSASHSQLKGHQGGYDQKLKTIYVSEDVVDLAVEEYGDDGIKPNWELMIILVEEFGHHIDNLLRTEYSSIGGDAPLDEGAKYAYAVVHLDYDRTQKKHYANYKELGVETRLYVDYKKFNEAVKEYLNEDEILNDDKSGDIEYFGSGCNRNIPRVSYGHESIEKDPLSKVGFSPEELKLIYVGNWERDYSQLIVPLLVRGSQETFFFKRETLTKVVDILFEVHFGEKFREKYHKVTMESLGVYLPEHHIDNPKGIEDGRADDPEFRGKWTEEEIAIDTVRGMKNYIATSGRGWATATELIKSEINSAVKQKRTKEGLRQLGRALHVIEDFYAHSNFIEVTLIKLGYEIYPWVPIPPQGKIPITTGVFEGLDTAATLFAAVGEMLQRDEPFEVGKRTTGQKITLILLRDRFPNLARFYEAFLNAMEKLKKDHAWIFIILEKTVGKITKWFKWLIGAAMRKIAEIIESIQTSSYDPNSSDPTHTQIAKDHDDHPFHVIAADLAMEAVRQIGEVIMRYWNWSPSAAGDIGSVLFPSEKYRYTDLVLAEKNKLDDFIKEIESHAQDGDTIHLIGQSSADGRAEYNLRLSEQRALTVGDYLRYKIKNVKLNFTFEAVGESGAAYGPEWRSTKIQLLSTAVPVNPAEFAAGFLVNPVDTNWMDEMVRTWAKENSRAIEQVRSKTKQLERPKAIKDKAEPLMEKNNQSAENMMKWVNTAEKVFGIFISPKEQN